ncbi:MAG: hypothetical protein KDC98_02530, partial [Planctomycetes bacterium]|nr:hypothetical protein [Planctomycetota bacterium]
MSSLFPPVANTPLRTLLMAALSWLGLAQCVSAQRRPTDGAIDRAAIEAVLQRLDAAFARSDLDGYLAMFEPDHAGTHALLGRRLQRVFGSG